MIITAKPRWAIHDTFAWIADNRIPTQEVHITTEKWKVPCDVYAEDSPFQLRTITEKRPDALTARFVRTWNQPLPGARDITSWAEFTTLISSGAGAR